MFIFLIFLSTNYRYGIIKLKKIIDYYNFDNYKIIINNSSFDLSFNFNYQLINIIDELKALLFTINYFNLDNNDFIIKFNGNCSLKSNSPFMKQLFKLNKNIIDYDVISKYFFTDIIVMKCKFIKLIEDNPNIHINLRWEKSKSFIEEKKQLYLDYLGIDISQKRNNEFTIY